MKGKPNKKPAEGSHGDHHWWRTISTFAPDWWANRQTLAGAYFAGALAVIAVVLAPWPVKFLIDNALGGQPLPPLLAMFASNLPPAGLIIALAVGYALMETIGSFCSALEQNLNAKIRERMSMTMRDRLLCHVQLLPLTHRTTDRSGEIVLRIVDDVTQYVRLLTKTLPVIIRHAAMALVIFVVMFWLEPWFGVLGLCIVAFMVWMARHFVGPLRNASRSRRIRDGEVSGLVQEIMRGLPSTQILGAEERVRERFGTVNLHSLQAGVHETRVAVGMERAMGITKGISMAIVVCGGGLLVLYNDLTIGGLTVATAYLGQLLKPVSKLNDLASAVTRGLARGDQLVALL
ncbi:MAG: ABC transporter transmembrane domain-containing protein, partial [Anaerolineales bacterium]